MANFVITMLVLTFVVFGPILFLWSLNTLFGLGIGLTLKTWFAALILGAMVGARHSSSK